MKVLFVQKEGGIFGAENYQLKVIPGLLNQGIAIEFLRLYTDYQGGVGGDFISRLKKMGVSTGEINIGKYPSITVLKRIHNYVKAGEYDLVHTHLIHADFYVTLAKKLFRGKYDIVSTKHGYDNNFTAKFGFDASQQRLTPYFLISRWAEKRMKASFTISNGLRDFFIKTGLTSSDKMRLIHYGFDMPDLLEYKGLDKYRFAQKQIIIAGRLVGFKGHEFLIEAMGPVVQMYKESVKLLIAGSGELEDKLKEKVTSLGLDNSVKFLGYTHEVGQLMANSDVVVVPSISEGFGVVFLEAFAAKTPVISWDVPAGNELMEDGQSGHLVEPYNVNNLSDKLIQVMQNDQGDIVKNAHDRLMNYFNLNRMVEETVMFYQDAMK